MNPPSKCRQPRSDPVSVLRASFGHAAFRPGQGPIVEAMVAGRDVLGVLPTGAGKSICYQVPALLAARPTIVVSPLIALMDDQVASLHARGIAAVAITSASSSAERREAMGRLAAGGPLLLYVAPERLASEPFRRLVAEQEPARIVVDEAHCISEWGHDFRPDYLRIAEFAAVVGRPPLAAFTATATPATRRHICGRLELRNPACFISPVDRPNLRWSVRPAACLAAAAGQLGYALGERGSGAGIVYVPTRALATGFAAAMRRRGVEAFAYHAGLGGDRRTRTQRTWISAERGVICATSAFGMGIDRPDVRLVAHVGSPGALEAYVQEAGRAGRDGRSAICLLLTIPGDQRLHRARLREANPAARRHGRHRLAGMRAYVKERRCRRRAIAAYFGESVPECPGCDLCDERRATPARARTYRV